MQVQEILERIPKQEYFIFVASQEEWEKTIDEALGKVISNENSNR